MAILSKLTSVTLVPLVDPINSYYIVISPKITSVTRVPLVKPINSYYMIIFPKFTSVAQVPLVEPINSYYMVATLCISHFVANAGRTHTQTEKQL